MRYAIIEINGVQYEAIPNPGRPGEPTLRPLLLKSSDGPPKPDAPGVIFIVYREDEILGWREAGTAWQALEASFGHPHNPRYRVIKWDECKHSVQSEALEAGRIDGKIWEGCPDCQGLIKMLNEQIVKLTDELASYKSIEIVNVAQLEMPHVR